MEPERRRYRPAKSDILAFCAGAAAVADHAVKAPRPKAVEGKRSLPEDGLALALLIRATHGGMAFDVSLIKNYVSPRQRPTMPRRRRGGARSVALAATALRDRARRYGGAARPTGDEWLAPGPEPLRLEPNAWILEAIDPHVKNGEVLVRVRAEVPELAAVEDEDLRWWFWHTRGGINVRTGDAGRPYTEPAWGPAAKPAADEIARLMIKDVWSGHWNRR